MRADGVRLRNELVVRGIDAPNYNGLDQTVARDASCQLFNALLRKCAARLIGVWVHQMDGDFSMLRKTGGCLYTGKIHANALLISGLPIKYSIAKQKNSDSWKAVKKETKVVE